MTDPGWYPDPGGQPRRFRYWDGREWSSQTTGSPYQTPPPNPAPTEPVGRGVQHRSRWWLGIVATILAIGLIVWGITRVLPGIAGSDNWWQPGGNSTQEFCPTINGDVTTPARPENPQQVTAGRLSYPTLGSPWERPSWEDRVPFGTLALTQIAIDQADYDGNGQSWVSSVVVSGLVSGDGFADSHNAADMVMRCIPGLFYSNTVISRDDLSSSSHTVDGHSGWLIKSHFSFNIPGLNAKGETVIVLVVQVEADQFGLFFVSVPDTSPDRLPDALDAMDKLTVT